MTLRKLVITSFLVLLCAAGARAEDLSAQADKEYRAGNFEEAISLYRELARQEPQNPFHYYNLGNAYYKTTRSGRAVANYYKAYELLPRNSDIRNNLAFALNAAGGKLIPEGMPEGIYILFHYFSSAELKGLTIISVWVALGLLAGALAIPACSRSCRRAILRRLELCPQADRPAEPCGCN